MPSLIRFLVVVVFLAGLVFAGMVALSVFVDPGQKDITVRVPVKDLLGG
ncbi:MAG TPA: histidine kinase [Devosiaceae bacterium]